MFPANHEGGCAWESGKVLPPPGDEFAAPAKKGIFSKLTAVQPEPVEDAPKTKGKK
jgi:hypothetical protein